MTFLLLFSVVFFARGLDLLSTLFVTPDLRHEANAIFRRVGWRWGIILNVIICALAATNLDATIIVSVASILTALTNFFGRPKTAWIGLLIFGAALTPIGYAYGIGVLVYAMMQLAV